MSILILGTLIAAIFGFGYYVGWTDREARKPEED